ncbi:hypothetical protein SAMN05428988_0151 [Chitinophaga sp. YR573]|uniref:hypothetical protein n=1 Tax=Chitinophaga sp. YR573 TaxID=1881040 RepID=UPI0008C5DB65|nr:hypothetical protein [Chitinophaga sp. YR573]SEV88856.1 hypothetical protein SAMN05428988_0151 [Chitinophaga sp. YR573]
MKEKILAQLRVKYPGVPKELLGQIADKMAVKVTAEDQIQGAIGELDNLPLSITDYAAFLQKEGDRRATDARKGYVPATEQDDEKKDPANPNPKDKPEKGGDSEIAKLVQAVTALTAKVDGYEKKDQQKSFSQQLNEKLIEKKIPVVLAKGRLVEKAEDIETVLAEIEADHNSYKQELANQGFSTNTIPGSGNSVNVEKTKVEADIGSWVDSHKPPTSQTKA